MNKQNDEHRKPKTRKVIEALEKNQLLYDRNHLKKQSGVEKIAQCAVSKSSPPTFGLWDSLYLTNKSACAVHEARDTFSNAKSLQGASSTTLSTQAHGHDSKIKRSKSIDFFIEGLLILAPDQKEALDDLLYSSSSDIDSRRTF